MALITKPDFTYVWASGGAVVAPNDAKKQLGWVAEAPPFQYDNWLQNRQDQMLAHINQRGMCVWDGTTNYEAGGLSYTQGSDGKIYKSVAASGPSTTVQDPTTDATDTYWTEAFASIGAFLTQAAADVRYARLSNNLSDLTNVATARANLGLDNSFKAGISGAFSNLKVSATGTSATVAITAASICLKNSSSEQVVVNDVSITPSLASSGVNGLDTGTSAINTWYSVWIIWNGTTTAGLLSLTDGISTQPTLPSGYTHKARVGWVRSDSNASNKFPLRFMQKGKKVNYQVAAGSNVTTFPTMASGAAGSVTVPTYVSVSTAAFKPPTAEIIYITVGADGQNQATIAVGTNDNFGAAVSATQPQIVMNSAATETTSTYPFELMLESANIFWATNALQSRLRCLGWEDSL